jgi:UDP-N-acetyl-D-glucosamine dehydrogenase
VPFEKNTLAVVGQGYVGLPLAIAAAKAGISTVGIEIDGHKLTSLQQGHSFIDDISNEKLAEVIASGKYLATDDFSQVSRCEFIAICVPTPIDESGNPDISALTSALRSVGKHVSAGAVVIIESTISPGTTRNIALPILVKESGGKEFGLVFSPERIDPSNASWNVTNTPKLVGGLTDNDRDRVITFYSQFISPVIAGSSLESIETAKLLENTFRLINISFINEFAVFCEKMGLDVREVINAAATKPYGFMPFTPSAGIGGHCIPVDPAYLAAKAREIGAPTNFIDHALAVNNSLGERFAASACELFGDLQGKRILLVGVAYKPNISDVRETPALRLLNALRNQGAEVVWHDEKVSHWMGESSVPLETPVDLIILVNPHSTTDISALKEYAKQHGIAVLDTRGSEARP